MAAVLGLVAAMTIGLSDLFGRRVMSASSALTAGATLHLFASGFLVAVALFTGSPLEREGLFWGGVSGIGLGAGIGCYYTGLTRSTATVVAPIVASLGAILPFAYTVLRGRPTAAIGIVGAGLVCIGLVLVTRRTASGRSAAERSGSGATVRSGALWGVMAGIFYALGSVGFVEAADAEGWWPAVGQRATAASVMVTAAALAGVSPLPPRGQLANGVMSGAINAVTSMLYLAALAADPTVGVIALSAFSAFSVLIGRLFFDDEVAPAQAVGVGFVVSGIAAVSVS